MVGLWLDLYWVSLNFLVGFKVRIEPKTKFSVLKASNLKLTICLNFYSFNLLIFYFGSY